MINKILMWIGKVALGKNMLEMVNGVNERLTGKRTEILIAIQALLLLLKKIGILPAEAAPLVENLSMVLLGAIPVTLAEKVKGVQEKVDSVIPDKK